MGAQGWWHAKMIKVSKDLWKSHERRNYLSHVHLFSSGTTSSMKKQRWPLKAQHLWWVCRAYGQTCVRWSREAPISFVLVVGSTGGRKISMQVKNLMIHITYFEAIWISLSSSDWPGKVCRGIWEQSEMHQIAETSKNIISLWPVRRSPRVLPNRHFYQCQDTNYLSVFL